MGFNTRVSIVPALRHAARGVGTLGDGVQEQPADAPSSCLRGDEQVVEYPQRLQANRGEARVDLSQAQPLERLAIDRQQHDRLASSQPVGEEPPCGVEVGRLPVELPAGVEQARDQLDQPGVRPNDGWFGMAPSLAA